MQTTIYSAEDEQELMARLWAPQYKDNPPVSSTHLTLPTNREV